jgi:hypothetical protein
VPQKLTLEQAGDSATFTVSTCRTVQTKFGDRMVFAGIDDEGAEVETPLMPEATATKQLDRIGLTSETVVGERLTFSRAANPAGKPYWNVDVPDAAAAPTRRMAPPEAAPVRSNPVKPATFDAADLQTAYLSLWDTMATGLALSCAANRIELTADAVQAATATIWIAAMNRGVMPHAPAKAAPAPEVKIPTTPPPSGKRLPAPATQASSAVRGSPAGMPDFSKFPPPTDDDNLPF